MWANAQRDGRPAEHRWQVMAAYRRVNDCGLTACTPGSAPGPTLGIEYGKAFYIR